MAALKWLLPCPECGRGFPRRVSLRGHLVHVHRRDPIDAYRRSTTVLRRDPGAAA